MTSSDNPRVKSEDLAAKLADVSLKTGDAPGSKVSDPEATRRIPSMRTRSDPPNIQSMSSSSNPLRVLNNARRPPVASPPSSTMAGNGLPQDMQAKMRAFHASRQGTPPDKRPVAPQPSPLADSPGAPAPPNAAALRMRSAPQGPPTASTARPAHKPSLSARRNMPKLNGLPNNPGAPPGPVLDLNSGGDAAAGSQFNQFSQFVDTKTGSLRFAGKAVIHGQGINFSTGSNFRISLDDLNNIEELGKGNYGTVFKVRHVNKSAAGAHTPPVPPSLQRVNPKQAEGDHEKSRNSEGTTGIIMAMKEIRLELDEARLSAIIMELDILHRCVSPYIIDFYGAFFQEGAVYICIEFMDGGSVDKLYADGIPENVLRKITHATTKGLKSLKDVHNIIHRDVKPTNILVNTRGQVKICDFGVSGNLVASIAKTNIGCQSYMAPERISGNNVAQAGANPDGGTYSVQSDVWSLGLSVIECALGRYPYPPETYGNIFSQLSVSPAPSILLSLRR